MGEEELKKGFDEFFEGGIDEENKKRFNLAITAYFKAITQICDIIIIRKIGFAPSSHSERFRLLERNFPPVYKIADNLFSLYKKTYSMPLNKESCNIIKNEIRNIIIAAKAEKEFERALQKIQK